MSLWLTLARLAVAANLAILLGLAWVWVGRYRDHGARHTLGLLVFGTFLLVENLLWGYFYALDPAFTGWYEGAGLAINGGMFLLCGLETVALLVVARVTWL